jgi:hypothetical protein
MNQSAAATAAAVSFSFQISTQQHTVPSHREDARSNSTNPSKKLPPAHLEATTNPNLDDTM